MRQNNSGNKDSSYQLKIREVIFGISSKGGKLFDVLLIVLIIASVTTVILDSIETIHTQFKFQLRLLTYFFTFIFSIEYLLRIYSSVNRKSYIFSFYGICDLIAITSVYLGIFVQSSDMALIVRILRIFRIFRIFRLFPYLGEIRSLATAISRSFKKISVFFFTILLIVLILGTLMYIVEGGKNGFSSIPQALYWSIVTITTVGYGDITPHTVLGKIIASLAMLIGYSIIAIPTGIVTAEISKEIKKENLSVSCNNCQKSSHDKQAKYCDQCGAELERPQLEWKENGNRH